MKFITDGFLINWIIKYSRIIYSDNRNPKDEIDVSTTLNTSNNYWTIPKEGQFGLHSPQTYKNIGLDCQGYHFDAIALLQWYPSYNNYNNDKIFLNNNLWQIYRYHYIQRIRRRLCDVILSYYYCIESWIECRMIVNK